MTYWIIINEGNFKFPGACSTITARTQISGDYSFLLRFGCGTDDSGVRDQNTQHILSRATGHPSSYASLAHNRRLSCLLHLLLKLNKFMCITETEPNHPVNWYSWNPDMIPGISSHCKNLH